MNKMPKDLIIEELLDMPGLDDVREELSDPYYINSKHGASVTYDYGCRGPLCGKANREKMRLKRKIKNQRIGHVPKTHYLKYDRDDLLDEIIAWHHRAVEERKATFLRDQKKAI